MKITNFDLAPLGLMLKTTVTVEGEEWNTIITEARKILGKDLKIKGFRPGQVPDKLLDEKVGTANILNRADLIAQKKVFDFLLQTKKDDLSLFRAFKKTTDKITFTFYQITFEWEKIPTLKLKQYKNLSYSSLPVEITAKDITNKLNNLRNQHADLADTHAPAKKDDWLWIDFEGKIAGKILDQATKKGHQLHLGSQSFIPGFEDGLLGCVPNEEKILNLQFPENYQSDLANQKIEFKVKVHKVQKRTPISDEQLIKKLDLPEVKNITDLKIHLQKEIQTEKKRSLEPHYLRIIKTEIRKKAEIDIPQPYLHREFERVKFQEIQQLEKTQKKSFAEILKERKESEKEFDVKLKNTTKEMISDFLAIQEIAKAENIKVDEKEIKDYYNFLTQMMKKTLEEVKKTYPEIHMYSNFLRFKVDQFLLQNNPPSSDISHSQK